MSITLSSRLISKVKANPETGCWEWTGYRMKNGYGQIGVNNRMRLAHRTSYELHCGEIPEGMWVCHRCDNPGCVNPEHLFLGTAADNTADMITKGRQASPDKVARNGIANGRAKLSEADVLAIRSAEGGRGLQARLVKQYGVGKSMISFIRNGHYWKHV